MSEEIQCPHCDALIATGKTEEPEKLPTLLDYAKDIVEGSPNKAAAFAQITIADELRKLNRLFEKMTESNQDTSLNVFDIGRN